MRPFLIILTLVAASIAYAGDCNDRMCTGEVEKLFLSSTGDIRLKIDASKFENLKCDIYSKNFFVLKQDHKNFDAIYAALLAHKMTGQELSARVSTAGTCDLLYITF